MEAIVLAGGRGTRLAGVVKEAPKPMAPVSGRPFLEYILGDLARQGVSHCVLAVGYKKESIIGHFGTGFHGMTLEYSNEDIPLKTGGAIKQAMALCASQDVIVVNGDTLFEVDLRQMMRFHQLKRAALTIALKRMMNFDRYGTVTVDSEDRILRIEEKRYCASGMINGGIYILNRQFLQETGPACFSFEKEILEPSAGKAAFYGFASEGYFIDIGIPADYRKAEEDFSRRRKAVFFDRDGTINADVHYLHQPEDLIFLPAVPEAIRMLNEQGFLVVVVTNQAGVARGYYREADVRNLHNYMNARLNREYGAHIDAFYYCPHHPSEGRGEYRLDCDCRKPKPGLLARAIRELNIDPFRAYMIGDQPWDVEAGNRAGVTSYLFQNNIREIVADILKEGAK